MSEEAAELKIRTVGQLKAALSTMPDDLEILVRMSVEIASETGLQELDLFAEMGTVAIHYDHTDDTPFCAIDFVDEDFDKHEQPD